MRKQLVLIIGLILASGPSIADEKTDCLYTSGNAAIKACSNWILSYKLSNQNDSNEVRVLGEAHLRRGRHYLDIGDSAKAGADFTKAIELCGKSLELINHDDTSNMGLFVIYTKSQPSHSCRSNAFYLAGDFQNAAADAEKAIEDQVEQHERTADVMGEGGIPYLTYDQISLFANSIEALGDWDRAVRGFDMLLALAPDVADLYFRRGRARQRRGDIRSALDDYNQAIQLDPRHLEYQIVRAMVAQLNGNLDSAIAQFGSIVSDQQNEAKNFQAITYHNRARAYQDKGDLVSALADYDAAIRLDPRVAVTFYERGKTRASAADNEGALADYKEAIRLEPDDFEYRIELGSFLEITGNIDTAISEYSDAIRINNRRAGRGFAAWFDGLLWASASGEVKPKRSSQQEALAFYRRGSAYVTKGDARAAFADFDEAIRLDPNMALAFYERGRVHTLRGDAQRALNDFSESLRLDPDFAAAYYERAMANAGLGKSERVLSDLNAAISRVPSEPRFYSARALAFSASGALDAAIADYGEAILLDPFNPLLYGMRAEAFLKLNKSELALRDTTRALALTGC